jgi:hypothetical protein
LSPADFQGLAVQLTPQRLKVVKTR